MRSEGFNTFGHNFAIPVASLGFSLISYNLPSCSYNKQDVIIRSIELIIAAFVFNREKLISLVSRSSTWDRKIKMIMSKIERLILYYALNIPKCFFFAKLINSDLYCCARPPGK